MFINYFFILLNFIYATGYLNSYYYVLCIYQCLAFHIIDSLNNHDDNNNNNYLILKPTQSFI